jgi:hypothetical protein
MGFRDIGVIVMQSPRTVNVSMCGSASSTGASYPAVYKSDMHLEVTLEYLSQLPSSGSSLTAERVERMKKSAERHRETLRLLSE